MTPIRPAMSNDRASDGSNPKLKTTIDFDTFGQTFPLQGKESRFSDMITRAPKAPSTAHKVGAAFPKEGENVMFTERQRQ